MRAPTARVEAVSYGLGVASSQVCIRFYVASIAPSSLSQATAIKTSNNPTKRHISLLRKMKAVVDLTVRRRANIERVLINREIPLINIINRYNVGPY